MTQSDSGHSEASAHYCIEAKHSLRSGVFKDKEQTLTHSPKP